MSDEDRWIVSHPNGIYVSTRDEGLLTEENYGSVIRADGGRDIYVRLNSAPVDAFEMLTSEGVLTVRDHEGDAVMVYAPGAWLRCESNLPDISQS